MTEAQIIHSMLVPDSRKNFCDNCAAPFNPSFALGTRIQHERVWVCTPQCYHQLKVRWTNGTRKYVS